MKTIITPRITQAFLSGLAAIGLCVLPSNLAAQSAMQFNYSGFAGAPDGTVINSQNGMATAELNLFHTGTETDVVVGITGSNTDILGAGFSWDAAKLSESKGFSVTFSNPITFTSIHAKVNPFQYHDYTFTFAGAVMQYNNDSTGTGYDIQQTAPDTFFLDALNDSSVFDGSFSVVSGGVNSLTIDADSAGRRWSDNVYLTFVGGQSVPEPSSALLVLIAGLPVIMRRKRA